MNSTVRALAVTSAGDVIAGGIAANNIARWDGSSWHAIGSGTNGPVRALTQDLSLVVVAGDFTTAGNLLVNGLAQCSSSGSWQGFHSGFGPSLGATCLTSRAGRIYAGGTFLTAAGVQVNCVARLGPFVSWLDYGVDGPVAALALLPTFELLVGGSFAQASGVTSNGIAGWDGTAWFWSLEVDAQLNIVGISTSNALRMTIGSF